MKNVIKLLLILCVVALFSSISASASQLIDFTYGHWEIEEDIIKQLSEETNCRAFFGDPSWTDYTFQLEAKKNGGAEGFLIIFGAQDYTNFYWANIGGWANTQTVLEHEVNGNRRTYGQARNDRIDIGRWYHFKIVVTPERVQIFRDEQLIIDEKITGIGMVGLGTWATTAEFRNISVHANDASWEYTPMLLTAKELYHSQNTWQETIIGVRSALEYLNLSKADQLQLELDLWDEISNEFPIHNDWINQDFGTKFPKTWFANNEKLMLEMFQDFLLNITEELGTKAGEFQSEFRDLLESNISPYDHEMLDLYVRLCEKRREIRLSSLLEVSNEIVFVKKHIMGDGAYMWGPDALSDGVGAWNFQPGSELCVLTMDGIYGETTTLLADPNGVIRNPDVSYEGDRILFSWKKSAREDDYSLYEIDCVSKEVKQLTSGLGHADYEGIYLPNGDILFVSTRCVQGVSCFHAEVGNFYIMDSNGDYMRRIGFDQVHTNFPSVMQDGRIIYTRWEYNDRGAIFAQSLFQMNSDGTAQTEFYGNNSWFPTSVLHARNIPGTQKIIGIFAGHHTLQAGKLGIIDPNLGRQESQGAQLIAPERWTPAIRVDEYGQTGELFRHPFPISETQFLVSYNPTGWRGGSRNRDPGFNIYFMDIHGRRELLAFDSTISLGQPLPLSPRQRPLIVPNKVDYREQTGIYYMHDIYHGPGLEGIERGSVKELRVVALEYRATTIGQNFHAGPAATSHAMSPIAIGGGTWESKDVLGSATVYEDGSALFRVPARTPVYFQALDHQGHAILSMRSWTTLQPGEIYSCVGCHEDKNEAPPMLNREPALAMMHGVEELTPFYDVQGGFSYPQVIQPILDKNCIQCHSNRALPHPAGLAILPNVQPDESQGIAFSLQGTPVPDGPARRYWSDSYLNLTQARVEPSERAFEGRQGNLIRWLDREGPPTMLKPYFTGAAKSGLITMLAEEHQGVKLTQEELDKIAAWIDLGVPFYFDYNEGWYNPPYNVPAFFHVPQYRYDLALEKRRDSEAIEQQNIQKLIRDWYGTP